MGVTRLSLGVENFDDRILEINGRAHRSPEIGQAYQCARALDFPQINIDLIAGMLGETEENWRACIEKTLELEPDSVTIYQMELPFNTTISKDLLKKTGQFTEPVANWDDEAPLGQEAFEALERAGYHLRQRLHRRQGSVADARSSTRDRLWQGADMAGLGVASFGHVNGVHMQNMDTWETYSAADRARRAPAQPRLPADRRGAADPRAGAAAQARLGASGVLPRQVPRGHPGAVQRRSSRRWPPRAI